jgi:hypothetical protein
MRPAPVCPNNCPRLETAPELGTAMLLLPSGGSSLSISLHLTLCCLSVGAFGVLGAGGVLVRRQLVESKRACFVVQPSMEYVLQQPD